MLVRLLESKNILMISSIFLLFVLVITAREGLPQSKIEWISMIMCAMAVGLSALFIFRSGVLSNPYVGLLIMLVYIIAFSGAIYNYQKAVSFLFLTAIFYLLQQLEEDKKIYHTLDLGLFLSFSSFLFFPSLFFFPVIVFFILAFTSFGIRGLLLFLMGFFIPVIFLLELFYLFGDKHVLPYLQTPIKLNLVQIYDHIGYLLLFMILLILSLYDYYKNYTQIEPYKRFQYFILGLLLLGWLVVFYFYMGADYNWLIVICLPVSVFIGRSLEFIKKPWTREILLWVVILSLLPYIFKDFIPIEHVKDWFDM